MYGFLLRRARLGLIGATMAALVVTGFHAETTSPASTTTSASGADDVTLVAARAATWTRVYSRTQKIAPAGSTFRARALIRARKRTVTVAMRVSRTVRGHVVASRTKSAKVTRHWRRIVVSVPAGRSVSTVRVLLRPRASVKVKGLRVARVTSRAVSVPAISGWTPNLSENFTSFSSSRWNAKNNTYSSNEDSYLLARNATVGGGVLRIQGKRESVGGRSYTSGYVDTNGKYSLPNYFRAEVRAKVPFEQGMWAAPLWFRPTDGGAGEIDMVETLGNERTRPTFHQTIHTEYGATHKQASVTDPFSSVTSSTGWHTYTMEKVPGRITMWVDGVKTANFTASSPNWYKKYYEVGKRWNLRVNLQIGGSWGGLPNSTTDWSPDKTAMQVDYIRTWVPS